MIYPWQQLQWQHLLQRYQQKKLPHALLLTGAPGMGKLDFAYTFAGLLLCEKGENAACGTCVHCRWYKQKMHPNFFDIQPEEQGKIIKIMQIRALIERLQQTAHGEGHQVVLITPAQALNIAAANALLKILEDPPGKVIFLLVSHQADALPATIRSRCQTIFFPPVPKTVAESWLNTKIVEFDDWNSYLVIADHAPLKALASYQENHKCEQRQFLENFVSLLQKKLSPVDYARQHYQSDNKTILLLLQMLVHDLIKMKLGVAKDFILFQSVSHLLQPFACSLPLKVLWQWQQKTQTVMQWLNENANLNSQLLLEDLFISFWLELEPSC